MRAATAADHSKPWVTGQPVSQEAEGVHRRARPRGDRDTGDVARERGGSRTGEHHQPGSGGITGTVGDDGAHAGGPVRWPGGGGAPVACEAAAARSLAAAAASCAGPVG